jgi:Ca2+-binding RTX toxin-like protein
MTAAGRLSGTGLAGSTVTVFDGATAIAGTAKVGGGGAWNFVTNASATTKHIFTAVETDATGHVSPTSGTAQLGTAGADTLTSTSGNDFFRGAGGADTFTFLTNFAQDVIADFKVAGAAHDVILFKTNPTLNSFANVLSNATQVGANLAIRQDANNTLTLDNVTKTSLISSDFKFA